VRRITSEATSARSRCRKSIIRLPLEPDGVHRLAEQIGEQEWLIAATPEHPPGIDLALNERIDVTLDGTTTRRLCPQVVIVHARLASILSHQRDDDVDVVAPRRRAAVPDRDPPALRPPVGDPGKPKPLNEPLRQLTPPPAIQHVLFRVQRQRAMPDVRVAVPDNLASPIAIRDLDRLLKGQLWLVQEPREPSSIARGQKSPPNKPDRLW
jgi:hypothetical protein